MGIIGMGDYSLHSACKVQIGDWTVKYWKRVSECHDHTESYTASIRWMPISF